MEWKHRKKNSISKGIIAAPEKYPQYWSAVEQARNRKLDY